MTRAGERRAVQPSSFFPSHLRFIVLIHRARFIKSLLILDCGLSDALAHVLWRV